MPRCEPSELFTSHLVEVSGWDEDRAFFVECSSLFSDDTDGTQVSLSRRLSEGALIFLRHLEPSTSPHPAPHPYEARYMGCDSRGLHRFRLQTVLPRYSATTYPIN